MQLSEFKESATFEEVWQDQQIDLLEPREYLGEVFAGNARAVSSAEMDSQIASLRANFANVTPQTLVELIKYLDVQLVKLNMEISTNYLPAIRFMVTQSIDFFLFVSSLYQKHKVVHGRMWRDNPDSLFFLGISKCLNERGFEQVDNFLACSEMFNDRVKELIKHLRGQVFTAFESYAHKTAERFVEEQSQLENFRQVLAVLKEDLLTDGMTNDAKKASIIDKIEESYGRVVISTLFIVNETSTTLRSSFNVIEHTLNVIITPLQEVKLLSDGFGCNFYDLDREEITQDSRPLHEQVMEYLLLPVDVQQDILIEEPTVNSPYDPLPDFKSPEAKLRTQHSIYDTLRNWFVCVCPFLDCFSDERRPEHSEMPAGLVQAIVAVPETLRDQLNPIFLVPNASSSSFIFQVRVSRGHLPQSGILVLAQDYLVVSSRSFTSETNLILPFSLIALVNEVQSFFGSKTGLEILMKGSSESLTVFLADEDRKEILKSAIGFGIKRSSRIYEYFVDHVDPGDLQLKLEELWQMHVRRARCWIMFASLVPILPVEKHFVETIESSRITDVLEVCLACGFEFNEAWCLDDWRKKAGAEQFEYTSPFFVPECYFNIPGTSPVQSILEAALHYTFATKYKKRLEGGSLLEVVDGTTIFNYSRDEILLLFEHCSKQKTERSSFILKQSNDRISIVLASHEEDGQLYGSKWATRVKDKCIRNLRSRLRKEKKQATAGEYSTHADQSTYSIHPQTQVEAYESTFEPQTSAPDPKGLEKNPGSSQSSEKDLGSFERVEAEADEASHA
jgi:hypothetical protein